MGKAEGSVAREEWHGHVTALSVAPEFRRLGLAAKLMEMLEEISERFVASHPRFYDSCWAAKTLHNSHDNKHLIASEEMLQATSPISHLLSIVVIIDGL